MSADEFTKLFKYMEERFDRIDERFEDTNGRIDQILNAVDALAKRQEIDEEERLVMAIRSNTWTSGCISWLPRSA